MRASAAGVTPGFAGIGIPDAPARDQAPVAASAAATAFTALEGDIPEE